MSSQTTSRTDIAEQSAHESTIGSPFAARTDGTGTGNILALRNITKSFLGVTVLHDITLEVRRGEVLGLVGENGAGKSTLMNILGGIHPADKGTMELDGKAYEPQTARDASKAGIAFIHQELNLFSNLTVAENLFIGDLPTGPLWSVQYSKMQARAQKYLDQFGVNVTPKTQIGTLPMGVNQTIEITKALIADANLMIFDEPTTSLSQKEKENLFGIIGQLRAKGVTIIYISHILEDVFALCDRIAVLRDGHLVGVEEKSAVDRYHVIKMMVGRDLNQVYPTVEKEIGEVVYEAQGITQGTAVQNVSFSLRRGEIVGLFGLMGAGRTELVRLMFGVEKMDAGRVTFRGKQLKRLTPEICIEQGMAYVTEDRRQEGLLMPKPVKDNLVAATLTKLLGKAGMVSRRREDQEAARAVGQLSIKVHNIRTQPVKNLSGGNQQKVVIGKWLMRKPQMLIVDEPTRGVDVGAKHEIYTIINAMAKEGATVLFISSEMEELMGLCDRIMVMRKGKIIADIPRGQYSQENIIGHALGGVN
jgi:ribose transport system ATP-binding protein